MLCRSLAHKAPSRSNASRKPLRFRSRKNARNLWVPPFPGAVGVAMRPCGIGWNGCSVNTISFIEPKASWRGRRSAWTFPHTGINPPCQKWRESLQCACFFSPYFSQPFFVVRNVLAAKRLREKSFLQAEPSGLTPQDHKCGPVRPFGRISRRGVRYSV